MTTAAVPSDAVARRELIVEEARALPAAPQVLAGIGELLQDANTDLSQIAAEIRLEPALAGRVIQMSNSVAFGAGQRAGSVEEAVNRVGFHEVLRLVGVAAVAGLVDRGLSSYEIAAERMRESVLFHALASEALAVHTGLDTRTAYTAGLLRGVGMIVLDRISRGRVPETAGYDPKIYPDYAPWELASFGLTSPEATGMILEEWRFPPDVVAALQKHRVPTPGVDGDRFACLLNLAGGIVLENGFALRGEEVDWVVTPEKLSAAGMSADAFGAAGRQAAALFARQRSLLY